MADGNVRVSFQQLLIEFEKQRNAALNEVAQLRAANEALLAENAELRKNQRTPRQKASRASAS